MPLVLDCLVELLIVEHSFLTRLAIGLLYLGKASTFSAPLVDLVDEDIFALSLL